MRVLVPGDAVMLWSSVSGTSTLSCHHVAVAEEGWKLQVSVTGEPLVRKRLGETVTDVIVRAVRKRNKYMYVSVCTRSDTKIDNNS